MRQTLATLASLLAFATPAVADGPVVVELYTSQGCSSCPPADEMLRELATRNDVIALALHVDYWDYIGWADSFADPAHTTRQQKYARVAGANTIYTTGVSVSLNRSGNQIEIDATAASSFPRAAQVQIVRFSALETVDIRRGENAGRQLSYANIVTSWDVVREWDGRSALDLTVDIGGTGPVAVIIQAPGPGAILAAAQLR